MLVQALSSAAQVRAVYTLGQAVPWYWHDAHVHQIAESWLLKHQVVCAG